LLGRCSTTWVTLTALFLGGVFSETGSQELLALGWLQITILLTSASWLARICATGHKISLCFLTSPSENKESLLCVIR
jgi:hypothetical protein